jgi:hypothetical protein
MKLSTATVAYLQDVVKTAKFVGVDSIIIEPGCVRGVDETNSRVICHNQDVPELEFGSISITRLNVFLDRLNIARGIEGFSVDVETFGDDPTLLTEKDQKGAKAMFARSATFKAKGMKLDYKASNPLITKVPRSLKDRPKYRLALGHDAVVYLEKGKAAFGTDEFTLILDDSGATIELTDINNDHMSFVFTDKVTREIPEDTSPISYSQRFPIAKLLPLFKLNPETDLFVSERVGYIQTKINNLTVCILPRQDNV